MSLKELDISVVIPLYNEEESLPELLSWIDKVMQANHYLYEAILVNDGSTDDSWSVIKQIGATNDHVKAISFRRNYGKAAALHEGFKAAQGKVVITMDADLQDSPDEIPELYRLIVEDGYDLVSGWKKKRYDPISKTIPTKIYNAATRYITGVKLHDMNCGLKSYKRDVIKTVEVYGEMHRYIPAMAKWAGFYKIGEKVVEHRARKYGTTKFGLERFVNGFLDLMTITFISRFGKRPMHFFGLYGTLTFMLGFLITLYLVGEKLYYSWILQATVKRDIVDQPLFYIALVTVIVGMQMFLAGFVAELIGRNSSTRNFYHKKELYRLDEKSN